MNKIIFKRFTNITLLVWLVQQIKYMKSCLTMSKLGFYGGEKKVPYSQQYQWKCSKIIFYKTQIHCSFTPLFYLYGQR